MDAFDSFDVFDLLDVMDWWGTGDSLSPNNTRYSPEELAVSANAEAAEAKHIE
ncbi:hypothetical protein KZ483_02955 [Paenibacillus sp. sptzw28]|uniref:hypothetical protein n=1 Tax=Paenibacillus sp. sptzw28 TaxID=715179 RepID=UPI001C6F5B41|nr:hypothetical protein [Paenibacillus sp. sptzw28]QYR22006.1 hypothetical protein KZ483_02955 [Paenibacillus sp. sptzw28]